MWGRGHKGQWGALLLGIASAWCSAQPTSELPGVETVRFRTYSNNEGLSQPTALAIAQDSAGFLWIGTQDGLNRFDGYGFKVYKHDRSDLADLSPPAAGWRRRGRTGFRAHQPVPPTVIRSMRNVG